MFVIYTNLYMQHIAFMSNKALKARGIWCENICMHWNPHISYLSLLCGHKNYKQYKSSYRCKQNLSGILRIQICFTFSLLQSTKMDLVLICWTISNLIWYLSSLSHKHTLLMFKQLKLPVKMHATLNYVKFSVLWSVAGGQIEHK